MNGTKYTTTTYTNSAGMELQHVAVQIIFLEFSDNGTVRAIRVTKNRCPLNYTHYCTIRSTVVDGA